MNLFPKDVIGLLSAGLMVWSAVASAQETPPVSSGVVLNGITTILGDHQAFFKVSFAGGAPEADFMLVEGQDRYGIQLIAVDAQLNTVTIRHQGLTWTIPICQTPTLLDRPAAAGGAVPGTWGGNYRSGMTPGGDAPVSGGEMQPATAGQFARTGYPGSGNSKDTPGDASGNNRGSSGNSDNGVTSANDAGGNGSGSISDNAASPQVYQWWIKEAQKIEQARVDTAPRVMAGEWPPYPLTPLTPAGTPAQLVGADSLFMDHGPGVPIASN